jgi:uncharacterized protein YjbJ (UPF0337 family)
VRFVALDACEGFRGLARTKLARQGRSLAFEKFKPSIPIAVMKASTRNRAAGNANIAKGRAKKVAGKALGKNRLRARGQVQEVAGKIQKEVGRGQKRDGY